LRDPSIALLAIGGTVTRLGFGLDLFAEPS
jgi:hypothetical protein